MGAPSDQSMIAAVTLRFIYLTLLCVVKGHFKIEFFLGSAESARVVVRPGSGEQVGDRNGFVAMRAPAADVDPAAGSLAVRAPLLAEVALLALGAGVDGGVAARAADRQGSDRGGRGEVAGSPRSLWAGR